MKLLWAAHAWDDYLYWQRVDPIIAAKINELVNDIRRDPFRGIGKPEPLKGDLQGWWSRRITREDRLIYRVSGKPDAQQVEIAACRYHY
jgi:toxin YoeB